MRGAETIGTPVGRGDRCFLRGGQGKISRVLHLALNLTLLVAAIFWLAVACWVYRDARRRSRDLRVVGASTLLGLIPVAGPIGYLLIRPPETRDEAKTRRIEVEALESLLRREPPHCPTCLAGVEASFLVCPVCTTRLKEPCTGCSAPLAPTWLVCPFCTLDVQAPPAYDLDTALTAEAALQGFGARSKGKRARPRSRRSRRRPRDREYRPGAGLFEEPTRGFEPRTPSLRVKCSTS